MKVAIVHDHLTNRGGAEQVTLSFASAFPNAPIFTLAYDRDNTYPEFAKFDVRVSCFQKISNKEKFVKALFFPFGMFAMQRMSIDSSYDVVLMSTTHCAKYVKIAPNAKVFCYAHNPFRLAWYPETYKQYDKSSLIVKKLFDLVLTYIRRVDLKSIKKVDFLITNSVVVEERLKKVYSYCGDICIIPPPVKLENFYLEKENAKKYYLVVSRLEYYKKVDLVIEAFNINKLPLVIVGDGVQEKELKEIAGSNIIFYKKVSKERLADLYANAIALIFPQLEDYGITPLEANASGTPVIAYGKGGILDTQIPYDGNPANFATAIFFDEQTTDSLLAAINRFELVRKYIDSSFIRNHADKFSEKNFILKIQSFIKEKASIN